MPVELETAFKNAFSSRCDLTWKKFPMSLRSRVVRMHTAFLEIQELLSLPVSLVIVSSC